MPTSTIPRANTIFEYEDEDEIIEPGNIDIYNRPEVRNKDGSISTVKSFSYNIDGVEILMPTISDDGKKLTGDEAVELYLKTGKHLGKFKTAAAANKYAKALHKQQEEYYIGE